MIAAVYKGAENISVEDYPLRGLKENEVLVEVDSCGLCGTDYHIFEGKAPAKAPVILGHEYSGIVVDKSPGLENISVGDSIVIDPNISCGHCKYCKKGLVHHCSNHIALGVTLDGGFAEYSIVPASQIYKLPNDFNLSIAAFSEPLSCCLRGIQQAEIEHGDSVVIIGGGSIGLMMIQLAKLSGASKVILVEPIELKRNAASKLGADLTLDPSENDLSKKLIDFTNGGANVVIECVGKKETVEMSLDLVDKGGTVVIFGLAPANVTAEFDLQKMFRKEIKIHNSFLNPFTFEAAVNLLVSGKIDVSDLISIQTPLANIKDLFYSKNQSGNIKIQVTNKTRRSNAKIFQNN